MGPRMMTWAIWGQDDGPFGGEPNDGTAVKPIWWRINDGSMMGRPPQMNSGGGGLLSKILGRGNPAGGAAGGLRGIGSRSAERQQAAVDYLQSLSNPAGLKGFLNNTQQVLKTAQSIGPMIQQYGPMVKNLPAMWRLYRGFKNASKSKDETTNKDNDEKNSMQEESLVWMKPPVKYQVKFQAMSSKNTSTKKKNRKEIQSSAAEKRITQGKVLLFQNYIFIKRMLIAAFFSFC